MPDRSILTAAANAQGRKNNAVNAYKSPVMLKEYPADSAPFQDDVRPFVDRIIGRHGADEWNAGVLSMELHRHMGLYNIIGTKMGIRAREVLDAGYDALRVVSWAGSRPPVSCMNDGLQTATGASLGRGTIEVVRSSSLPSADFIIGNRKLSLTLKKGTEEKINMALRGLSEKHGGTGAAYFAGVRELSMEYWMDLDRNEIFEETRNDHTESEK
jgi:pyrimidine-specific ribonucleoside hydrolase